MRGCACDCGASSAIGSENAAGVFDSPISDGLVASSQHRGCFPWCTPMMLLVSPLRGDSSTGEPDAGDPPVRFGGRGERNQSFLPTPISCVSPVAANLA